MHVKTVDPNGLIDSLYTLLPDHQDPSSSSLNCVSSYSQLLPVNPAMPDSWRPIVGFASLLPDSLMPIILSSDWLSWWLLICTQFFREWTVNMPPIYILAWRLRAVFLRSPVLSKAHLLEILCASHNTDTPEGETRWTLEVFTTFSWLFTGLMPVRLISPDWLSEDLMNVLDYSWLWTLIFISLAHSKSPSVPP